MDPLPTTPPHVKGVLNLMGQMVSVIDLPKALKMKEFEPTAQSVMIVLEYETGHIGLLVDSVSDVIGLSMEQIQPAPLLEGLRPDHFLGLGVREERMIILLNIPSILSLKPSFQKQTPPSLLAPL